MFRAYIESSKVGKKFEISVRKVNFAKLFPCRTKLCACELLKTYHTLMFSAWRIPAPAGMVKIILSFAMLPLIVDPNFIPHENRERYNIKNVKTLKTRIRSILIGDD